MQFICYRFAFYHGLLLFFLVLSMFVPEVYGAVRDDLREIKRADAFASELKYDSALNIYRRIANTYRANMPKDEKGACLKAVYGCVDANLYRSNFSECMNYILLAEEIREADGISDDALQIYYSALYIAMAAQFRKSKLLEYAVPHARKALRYGLESGDYKLVSRSFSNLINCLFLLEDETSLKSEMQYLREHGDKENWRVRYLLCFAEARMAQIQNKNDRALEFFDIMLGMIPPDSEYDRDRGIILKDSAYTELLSGRRKNVTAALDSAMRIAMRYNMHDLRYTCLSIYQMYYLSIGDSVNASVAENDAVNLMDSLKTYFITDDLVKLEGMSEQKVLRREILKSNMRHTIVFWAFIAAALLAAGTIIIIVILRRKNHDLEERARLLRRSMRNQYEQTNFAGGGNDGRVAVRYESSNMGETEKDRIEREIGNVLDSGAAFDPEFSLGSLVEAVGSNQKNVSQVIGERFGSNFPTLINKVRIVEACRRLDSKEYVNWSVEGIAESVGYSHRSTFSANFKKVTGMGIREYRKMSEKELKAAENV